MYVYNGLFEPSCKNRIGSKLIINIFGAVGHVQFGIVDSLSGSRRERALVVLNPRRAP
jgi:hypothetical protein